MRILLFLLLAGALSAPAAAQDAAPGLTVAPKVLFTLQGMAIAERDVMVTKKDAYIHVLLDLYPYKERYDATEKGTLALGEALAKEVQKSQQPGSSKFKVDLVEFKDRDDYGAPVWSSVKILMRHEYDLGKAAAPPAKPKAASKKKPRPGARP